MQMKHIYDYFVFKSTDTNFQICYVSQEEDMSWKQNIFKISKVTSVSHSIFFQSSCLMMTGNTVELCPNSNNNNSHSSFVTVLKYK